MLWSEFCYSTMNDTFPFISYEECNITIELRFAGINMFLARLGFILDRAQ